MRMLLIHGARTIAQRAEGRTDMQERWLCALTHRKGTNVAPVALANKNARVIWALLAHDEKYRHPRLGAGKVATVFGRRRAASRLTQGGFTPRSAARTIRDDTEGRPARSDPGQIVGPSKAVVLMRRTRVFHQGPYPCVVHREAGYIDAALFFNGSSRDTPSSQRRLGPYKNLC